MDAGGWEILEQATQMARRGESFALATVVWRQGPSSGQQGSRAIITQSGEVSGWIGGACAEPVVLREARRVIGEGVPRLLLLGPPEVLGVPGKRGAPVPDGMTVVPIACQSEGALEVYIEPVVSVPGLVIVGRSPMAHTLAGLAAALGWRVSRHDGPGFTAADVPAGALVVVATQGHGDEDAIEQAVAARPAYLGLVGSARRGAAVLGYLAERGVDAAELGRVHVPAGLDLGRISHREIAVSILAELVRLRAEGALAREEGARVPRPAGAAEAADPVCGMTVTAGAAAHPFEYQGVTYYFCRGGCRAAFEADPAAYVKESRC
jgi:xanthine dehydrogenase accessory factor